MLSILNFFKTLEHFVDYILYLYLAQIITWSQETAKTNLTDLPCSARTVLDIPN